MTLERTVFTIGHSTHAYEDFRALLRLHGVEAVVDVRSSPYSRRCPQFSRGDLERALKGDGFTYLFLGRELGGRGTGGAAATSTGRVSYRAIGSAPEFELGLNRVQAGSRKFVLALLCAERDPLECHRALLVSRRLHSRGQSVTHILADGSLETHADAEMRLRALFGLEAQELVRTDDEILDDAYARQEARVAYVDKSIHLQGGEPE